MISTKEALIATRPTHHVPVMLDEVLGGLAPAPGFVVADGTLGTAGHGVAFLRALHGAGVFVGLDRDPDMLEIARGRIMDLFDAEPELATTRVILAAEPYENLGRVLAREGLSGADAILLDLGFNSLQVDDPERGFSFTNDGPLDGRYNASDPKCRTIAQLVNEAAELDLADWIRLYGDERYARAIARRIVARRERQPFERTADLAEVISTGYPVKERYRSHIHPATRSFQALRLVANDELGGVKRGIANCLGALAPGGRLAVIAYHSGEDRIAKALFDEAGAPKADPSNPYAATTTAGLNFELDRRSSAKPSAAEVVRNPRARSARLRLIRRRIAGGDQ
ncbi:MAG: 16S rRNA (cytosine(1402)-N(4))-methyltransferase RsmH [Sumerlaeia bacterium]